jgi:pimeloyl-ACP methyl ester carboxylesterase
MNKPLALAAEKRGDGPDLVLFHGGMGCWKHWIRNIGPLSEHFTVHALDLPGYGESAGVPRDTSGERYLELMQQALLARFPDNKLPLRFAGFSFGAAVATHLAVKLGERVTHLCLISPAGFPPRTYSGRPTRSYKEAGDDEALFRDICRHNLRVNMLSSDAAIDEQAIDIQAYGIRHTRFDSRRVSHGGILLNDLSRLFCRFRLLWGEYDDAPFRPAGQMIAQVREVIGDDRLDLHRIPAAGHWSAYENASTVNRLMMEFFTSL